MSWVSKRYLTLQLSAQDTTNQNKPNTLRPFSFLEFFVFDFVFLFVCFLCFGRHVIYDHALLYTLTTLLGALYMSFLFLTRQWRHNGYHGVSNHQPHDYLPNRLFRRRPKKTSKLRVTGLFTVKSPVTGDFPAQRASNAENVSIRWHHHENNSTCPRLINP